MPWVSIRVFLMSLAPIASLLLEFFEGDVSGSPRTKRLTALAIGLVVIVIGLLSNMAITLSKENGDLKRQVIKLNHASEKRQSKIEQYLNDKATDNSSLLFIRRSHEEAKTDLNSCQVSLAAYLASQSTEPVHLPPTNDVQIYEVPFEVRVILDGVNE